MTTRVLSFLLLFSLITACTACKRSGTGQEQNSDNSSSTRFEVYTAPPFSTREPERYQATRIITMRMPDGSSAENSTQTTVIARDHDRRREDYEIRPGVKVSFLELPTGMFVLHHEKKIYAPVKEEAGLTTDARSQVEALGFSPESFIYESTLETRYEKLGAEEINGRATVKYRASVKATIGEAGVVTETFLWIDEALGMPIKTETRSSDGRTSYTMELRDINREVPPTLFEIPADYRQVSYREFQSLLHLGR